MDRTDEQIRALVVELVDDPPPPPPFPGHQVLRPASTLYRRGRRGPIVALAVLLSALLIGLVPLILTTGEEDLTGPQPTAEHAMRLLVNRVNAADMSGVMNLLSHDTTCRIDRVPEAVNQNCQDLFGFLITSNAIMTLDDCVRIGDSGDSTVYDGSEIESYNCVVSFRTDIHSALGIPSDETADMNPVVQFGEGRIQGMRISNPFTGDIVLDSQLWSYLLSVDADYVNEEGIPIFTPEMADEFMTDAVDFAANSA